jgi:uracil phosphoribosyltransferase
MSQKLDFENVEIETPLASMEIPQLKDSLVLATILRAGLPLHQGLLNYFDTADSAFVTAYRKYDSADEFSVEVDYMTAPDLTNKILILADPMIASGVSLYKSYKALLMRGEPKEVHVVGAIVSAQGLAYLKKKMGARVHFWVGAVDLELTAKAYIVPGLGDAGDLAFGNKE